MVVSSSARIVRVSGPLVEVECAAAVAMHDLVGLGPANVPGEVVAISDGQLTVQAYEYTGGLTPGDAAVPQGGPLSAPLGPGLLGGVFDGLLRPLTTAPTWLRAGRYAHDDARRWEFDTDSRCRRRSGCRSGARGRTRRRCCRASRSGSTRCRRDGRVDPPGRQLPGEIRVLASVGGTPVSMSSQWPVRLARPYRNRRDDAAPLNTGQRVVDQLFPIARGSNAAVPGGFGTGKTVLLQQIGEVV